MKGYDNPVARSNVIPLVDGPANHPYPARFVRSAGAVRIRSFVSPAAERPTTAPCPIENAWCA